MADAFDLSGLAGQLQGLLGQLAPSQDEIDRIRREKALTFGLGLLGVRKGFEGPGIAQSGLAAIEQGRQSMKDLRAQKMEGLKLVEYLPMLQQMQDAASARKTAIAYATQNGYGAGAANQSGAGAGAGAGAEAPTPPLGFGMNDRGAGPLPQTPALSSPQPVAPQLGAAPQGAPAGPMPSPAQAQNGGAGAPSKNLTFQYYSGLAQQQYAQGNIAAGDAAAANAEKYRPKRVDTKTLTQNGQRVTVNFFDDGSTQVVPFGPDQEKAHFLDTGQQIGAVDPFTGKPIAGGGMYQKQQTPDSAASNQVSLYNARQSNALGYANLAESKRYHNMELGIGADGQPTNIDAVAKAIANYDQAPLGSFTAGKPFGAAIMSKVMELNPTYDAKNYATAQQTANAFAKGPQGNTVRSIGVAMQHLDTLGQAVDALHNTNIPLFNKAANFVATQTGQPAPTNFNAVRDIVGNEIVKAIVGSGGGVGDREKAQQTVAAANSPAQLNAVVNSYKNLFAGQLSGLEQQYKAGTQRDDFATRFLPPQVQELRKRGGATPRPQVIDFNSLPR